MLKNGITNTFTISCKRELRLNIELKYTASDMKYLGFSEKCLKFYQ